MPRWQGLTRWMVVAEAALLLGFTLAVAVAQQEAPKGAPTPPHHPLAGRLLQELKSFDNPEAAIFSEDGRFVFISNSAELGMPDKGFHWTEKAGFVSKLSVEADGTLKVVNQKLITGLTAPLGMAVNPVATKKFPKGSIFLCTGGLPLADASGNDIKDPTRLTSKIVVFDVDGRVLGEIPWNAGSMLAKTGRAPATLPNAAAFDRQGNFYVTDTGLGGGAVEPKLETRPGVMMIPHDALDGLAAGEAPSAKPVFLSMPGGPDGIEVSPVDGTIHVNTVGVAAGLPDSDKGGMWRLTREDFKAGRLRKAFSSGWGALDGLVFTRKGTRLDTQILPPNYITVVPVGSDQVQSLTIGGLSRDLAGPADIALHTRRDGSSLLVIPELSATSPNNNDNPVLVVLLPAGL
jgi:DNA-binding beta-propeller fold protein YncE